jgi:hypothetical protein
MNTWRWMIAIDCLSIIALLWFFSVPWKYIKLFWLIKTGRLTINLRRYDDESATTASIQHDGDGPNI